MNRYLFAFLCVGFTALATAQETPVPIGTPANVLTWQDCVRLAAQNNPDFLSALAASESTRALYLKSYNGILPQLSLSNSYSDSKSGGLETKSWSAEGTASLDLIDFGQWASIQSASASLREAKANLKITSSNTLLNLYKAFTAVLYNQDAIQVNTTIRDTWKTNAQMVTLRYRSGRESKGNSMNTNAQALQAELALQQSSRDLHVAQQELSQAIGKEDFSALVVTGTWSASPLPTPRPDFNAILANHPQIEAQLAIVDQARAGVNIARSSLLPTLSLNASKGTVGPTEFPKNPFWSFGGSVNYPLFAGGLTSTYYASQSAERLFEKANEDLRSLRNQVRSSLESAWSSYAQAQDQVQVQSDFLAAAKQRKDESDVRYQSGLMTFEEWNLVIQDYVNFQQSFLRARQNLMLAEAQWRFTIGEQL